jgi:hypothetical protein
MLEVKQLLKAFFLVIMLGETMGSNNKLDVKVDILEFEGRMQLNEFVVLLIHLWGLYLTLVKYKESE